MRCDGCGGYLDVTLRHDQAYIVDEHVCGQCKAIDMYREEHKATDKPGRRLTAWATSIADALQRRKRIT